VISQNLNLNQLNGLYNAADCYVSPYRAEGFNLTPLEAAAAGTPIIVTKGGSTDDYVDESFATQIASKMRLENGMSFLEPSLESLVEKIANQINRKSIDINIKARQTFINQTFTWESIAKKFILEFSI
jgi:glycosyltransferase involved in cell wall biosynthesis